MTTKQVHYAPYIRDAGKTLCDFEHTANGTYWVTRGPQNVTCRECLKSSLWCDDYERWSKQVQSQMVIDRAPIPVRGPEKQGHADRLYTRYGEQVHVTHYTPFEGALSGIAACGRDLDVPGEYCGYHGTTKTAEVTCGHCLRTRVFRVDDALVE